MIASQEYVVVCSVVVEAWALKMVSTFCHTLNGAVYGWIGQQSGSGFSDLAPSILHYNWF
jgi:hypothetical protein